MAEASLINRWFEEVWNNRNADVIDEMFATDGVANGLKDADGNAIVGPAGYEPFRAAFLQAFPDIRVTVEDTVTEGDKIAARCHVTGTHCGN